MVYVQSPNGNTHFPVLQSHVQCSMQSTIFYMSEQQRFNIMSEQILVCADMCEYFLTLILYSQKILRYVYFAVES